MGPDVELGILFPGNFALERKLFVILKENKKVFIQNLWNRHIWQKLFLNSCNLIEFFPALDRNNFSLSISIHHSTLSRMLYEVQTTSQPSTTLKYNDSTCSRVYTYNNHQVSQPNIDSSVRPRTYTSQLKLWSPQTDHINLSVYNRIGCLYGYHYYSAWHACVLMSVHQQLTDRPTSQHKLVLP